VGVRLYAQKGSDTAVTVDYAKKTGGNYKVVFKSKHPFCYMGFSGGINNPSGMLGFDVNIPQKNYGMIGAGLGFSTWGNKAHADYRHFFGKNHLGWSLLGGLAVNSGVYNFRAKLRTMNHTREPVTINMDPTQTIFLGASHYSKIGRSNNRFFVNLGWNFPLLPPNYHITYNGPDLSNSGSRYLGLRKPGGPMAGIGVLFGLYHYSSHKAL